jgi:hypothetical protein
MDNYFHNCPPMMEDQGRHLSDFQSSTRRDEYIKYVNNIWRDDQYRLFLQTNGKTLADNEWEYHRKHNSCWVNPCVHQYPTRCQQKHYVQERQVFDSVYDLNTMEKYQELKKCPQLPDYRLTN